MAPRRAGLAGPDPQANSGRGRTLTRARLRPAHVAGLHARGRHGRVAAFDAHPRWFDVRASFAKQRASL